MNIYTLIVINIIWIVLLFYPRFCKKQLWKTIISVGHPLFLWLYFIVGFGFFTATPDQGEFLRILDNTLLCVYFLCKTVAFIWILADMISISVRSQRENKWQELCRCTMQMILFVTTFVYLNI